MKYVLQVNTGSFHRSTLSAEEIEERIEKCADILDIDKVIFGWADDPVLNEEICTYLKTKNIESWLWLPVFSEIYEASPEYPCVEIGGQGASGVNQTYEGEKFEFGCPQNEANLERVKEVYTHLTSRCHPDGIFLDRIRYGSAANSPSALYGCWCPLCKDRYIKAGIHIETIREMAEKNILPFPSSFKEDGYHYIPEDLDLLMKEKEKIISEDVLMLAEYFRTKGHMVGIDVFSPVLAPLVAQDLSELGRTCDFIKPMLYLKTNAPAGIPFELNALKDNAAEQFSSLWNVDVLSIEGTAAQIEKLNQYGIHVIPGVDVNEVPGICDSSPDYAKAMLKKLKESGCTSAVLSWDAMKISDEMLKAVAEI